MMQGKAGHKPVDDLDIFLKLPSCLLQLDKHLHRMWWPLELWVCKSSAREIGSNFLPGRA